MSHHLNVSGVFPHLTVKADHLPRRTETGIGALMPWAGKLWMVSYVAHLARSGAGTGLWEIDENLSMTKHPMSIVGTYANRMMHSQSDQILIGPHVIDHRGNVSNIPEFGEHRLTATMEHPEDPENKVLYLTMEGLLYEVDLHTLIPTQLYDLMDELDVPETAYAHFKGGYVIGNRIYVANNTYEDPDFLGTAADGRLAEFDGTSWSIVEKKPFVEIAGRKNMGQAVFATGWDNASALLKVSIDGEWSTYRLPKASHTFDHMFTTEWPRIREVESERFLMDAHYMFYELSPLVYDNKVWGVRPISTHLRIIPDFCSWRGMLVLAGNQVTPISDSNLLAGEPQSNLWFGKTDDLWNFGGKPAGWGGPWWKEPIAADTPSDPYLMTGFDRKVLHVSHDSPKAVDFLVEIDFHGTQDWVPYATLTTGQGGYAYHTFPEGFSAHWVRITASANCRGSAQFVYT
ncbi:MAG: hypothetical protein H0V37_12885 [Chloroflexia bacterium]|nr:hypothetical protein [Chloroflexia bacterium]